MELINKFKNYMLEKSGGASQATVKNYLADVKQFIAWVETTYKKTFKPEDINLQVVTAFKSQKSQVLSASSLDRHISSLRKFFTFLKLNGDITTSPFDTQPNSAQVVADPWHLHDFKNYLYVYNASHLTIKNYIIDVKQFIAWVEEVLNIKEAWHVADKDMLGQIDNKIVNEYKDRLLQQHVFSPASINRKLSSLRKYLSWAGEQGYMSHDLGFTNYDIRSLTGINDIRGGANLVIASEARQSQTQIAASTSSPRNDAAIAIQSQRQYSKIPPIRLFQKLTNAGTLAFDLLIIAPVAHAFRKVEHGTWIAQGKPLFVKSPLNLAKRINRFIPHVNNISKEFYAPLSISTRDFPWYRKVLFHIRHTRPNWYHKYHQLAIAHYFNWAILIIFATAIGFGMYNNFVAKPGRSLATSPTNPPIRVLSFQGRLTDANDNPITSPSWIRFIIYNNLTSSSSARLWEEVDKVTPDQDGIFSLLLGSSGATDGSAASLCNAGNPPTSPATGACGIPSSLFANNNALWLGVTVETTAELAPREQLATVAFASNSETLQGLPPITQTGAGTSNVVLALDSGGNLSIGASTTFQSTSGQFTISGNTVSLNTNAGTNGNITLAPDGTGFIDLQRPLQTSTNNGDVASVPNALTIEDLTAILATSSGQSALTINQNGTGPIISASHSGTAEFTVGNDGGIVDAFTPAANNAVLYVDSTTGKYSRLTTSTASQCLLSGTNTPIWTPCNPNNYWQLSGPGNAGVLSPLNIQNDLAIGAAATGSATPFQIFGQNYVNDLGTVPAGTATTSGNLTFRGTPGSQTVFQAALLNGSNFGFYPSVGGDKGIDTPALYVANNGKVGIGTNAPVNSLQVGSVGSTGYVNNNIAVGDGSHALALQAGATGYLTASGNLVLGANTNTTNQLFLSTAGNVGIGTSTLLSTLDVRGQSGTTSVASASGNTTFAALVTDNSGKGDLFTASTSGLPKFTILNSGSIKDSNYTTDKGILFSDANGLFTQTAQGGSNTVLHGNVSGVPTFSAVNLTADVTGTLPVNKGGTNGTATPTAGGIAYGTGTAYAFSLAGSAGQCLTSNAASAPTWGTCGGGGGGSTNFWTINAGAISTYFPSVDILAGTATGATTSAKFAVTGLAGALTPFASVSATVTSGGTGSGITIGGDGTIQSLENKNLTIGGNTTGDIILSPAGGTARGHLQFANLGSGLLHSDTSGFITSSAVNLANGSNDITGTLSTTNGGTGLATGALSSGDLLYYNSGTAYTNLAKGADNTILNIDSTTHLPVWTASPTFGGTVTFNGNITGAGNAILPVGNGTVNLGGTSNYFNTIYANSFASPTGNGTSGFWTVTNNTNLYPTNTADDLLIGGTATASATPFQIFAETVGVNKAGTATTSGNLTFRGTPASQTQFKIDLLNGSSLVVNRSVGGDGGETALLTLGNDGNIIDAGNLAVNGSALTTSQTTFNAFTTNATALGLGVTGGTTTINSGLVLTGNFTLNGQVATSLIPTGNSINIGSSTNNFGTVWATNLQLPITGGVGGYWQLSTGANFGVLSPTNLQNDLAIGANATGSATPFQIFANTFSGEPAGTASTSGFITHRGTPGSQTVFKELLLNGSSLGFYPSVGGDAGIGTPLLYLANNSAVGIGTNIPTATLDVAGAASISSTLTFRNNGTATIQATNNNQLILGGNTTGNIVVNSNIASNIIPNAPDTYNLGSATNEWNNLYVRQIISPSGGGVSGYWQLNSNVLSPTNNWNDLDIGGTATGSALQVFGTTFVTDASINSGTVPAGTASTSGNMSFRGTAGSQTVFQTNILNGASLGFYNSVGGDKGITNTTPTLFLSAKGYVGIGTNNPSSPLQVAFDNGTTPSLLIGGGGNVTNYLSISGNRTLFGYDGSFAVMQSAPGHGIAFQVNTTPFGSTSSASAELTKEGFFGIGTGNSLTNVGNAQLVVNQTNNFGLGDIFTASASGTTKFVINNNGDVGIGPSLVTAQGILDVGSAGPLFPSDLTLGQTSTANFVLNPSFENTSTFTNWTLSATAQLTTNAATESALFGSKELRFYNVGPAATYTAASGCISVDTSATYTASSYIYRVSGFTGNTGMDVLTFTNGTCSAGQATAGRVNTTATNAWTRVTSTISTGGGILSVEVRFITDGSNTTSRAYADGFQLEETSTATPYFDGSFGPGYTWDGTPNLSNSRRIGNTSLAYYTLNSSSGIGAASRSIYPTLKLDQDGTGDIIAASASGVTVLNLSSAGQFFAKNLYDIDNPIYYIDPAGLTTSASLAGSITFTPSAEHDINYLNGSAINFRRSVGGDTVLTSSLYIAANGNVGIGTTNPGQLLSVKSSSSSINPAIESQNDSAVSSFFYTGRSGNAAISGKTVLENGSGNAILLNPSGGNVGIGTTSPNALFDVRATTDQHVMLRGQQSIGSGGSISSVNDANNAFEPLQLQASLFDFTNGNVGIGTTSPNAALEVYNSAAGTLFSNGNLDPAGFTPGSGNWGTTTSDPEGLAIGWNRVSGRRETDFVNTTPGNTPGGFSFDTWNGTTYTQQFQIDGSGNAGFGTAIPGALGHAQLETYTGANSVAFSARNIGSTASPAFAAEVINQGNCSTCHGLFIGAGLTTPNANSTSTQFIQFDNAATTVQEGHISGINGTGVAYLSGSDSRIKTDIAPTHMGLSDLMHIQIDDFHFTSNPAAPLATGFIAQQLYSVFPDAVSPPSNPDDWYGPLNPQDVWSVDYGRVTPLIIKSVQELSTKVDTNYASLSAQLANVSLTQTGNLVLNDTQPNVDFTIPHYYALSDALGNPISQMGAFVELAVGNLRAGSVQAQQVLTNSLAVATDNVTIAGQSLNDYITGIVNQVLTSKNQGQITNSPIATINELHTGILSPLGDNPHIAIRLNNSEIQIAKDASGSAVASIDNNGNATFSGTLNSGNLAVNGDATVSGTLYADKIKANSIDGLSEVVSTLSAQNITNVNNIYFSTPSATPSGENFATGLNGSSSTNSGVLNFADSFANIASYSAFFAYVPNLKATTGIFDEGLVSLGPTSLTDTSIAGQLSIGGQMILADNSINVLGGDLELQPLKQGGIAFAGHQVYIDSSGNLSINGNTTIKGNLAAGTISPLAGNDLNISLQNGAASGSANANLNVKNASGSAIFALNQVGDLVASGEATVSKLNFSLVQPALAVSDTEVIATGSAGTAAIKAHQTEITIDDKLVTNRSLIYITPVGESTVTPYLMRQTSGTSFTVGIPLQQITGTTFNWLIVN